MTEKFLPVEDGMYILPNGERISVDNVRPSLDGDFHWCRYRWSNGTVVSPSGKARCLYVPNNGV